MQSDSRFLQQPSDCPQRRASLPTRRAKKRVSRVAVQTRLAVPPRMSGPDLPLNRSPSRVLIYRMSRHFPRPLPLSGVFKLRSSRKIFHTQSGRSIHRRHSSVPVSVSSDQKSLRPEVCPFIGMPALQSNSLINENNLSFIT